MSDTTNNQQEQRSYERTHRIRTGVTYTLLTI